MPGYIVISAAALRDVTEIEAASPLEAIKRAAEQRGGGGRYVCVAALNIVYANCESAVQTVVNVTQESARDLSRTL